MSCECVDISLEEEELRVQIQEETLQVNISEESLNVSIADEVYKVDADIEEFIVNDSVELFSIDIQEETLQFDINEVLVEPIPESDMPYDKLTDHVVVGGGIEDFYIGRATPGTVTSSPSWQIVRRRLTEIGDEVDVQEIYANGLGTFVHVWDNRLSYTY